MMIAQQAAFGKLRDPSERAAGLEELVRQAAQQKRVWSSLSYQQGETRLTHRRGAHDSEDSP